MSRRIRRFSFSLNNFFFPSSRRSSLMMWLVNPSKWKLLSNFSFYSLQNSFRTFFKSLDFSWNLIRPVLHLLPDAYRILFQSILTPAFWDRSGNIPALSRLVQAYIEKAGETIVLEKIVRLLVLAEFGSFRSSSSRPLSWASFNVWSRNQKCMITKDLLFSIPCSSISLRFI